MKTNSNKKILQTQNLFKFAIGLAVIILMLFALFKPDFYISTAYDGLVLWATNLLPALFPFFVFTKIIVELNILKPLSHILAKPMKLLFNTGKNSGYLYIVSMLCGYPIGSKIIVDAYNNGQIDYTELHRLTTITSISGPLFIVGTVGISMLGNSKIGYIILFAQIIASILNGILFRKYTPKTLPKQIDLNNNIKKENLLVSSINSSIQSILLIGGLVTVFFVGIEVLNSFINLPPLTQGMIELTKGCYEVALLSYSPVISATLCSMLIGFGGFCIHAQSYFFLSQVGISYSFFLTQKCTQLLLSGVVTYFLALLIL